MDTLIATSAPATVRSSAFRRSPARLNPNRLKAELRTSCCVALLLLPLALSGQTLGFAKDGSGVRGYSDTPIQPWSGFHVHDADRPAPKRIDPSPFTVSAPAPADAIVLFAGKDLSAWQSND